MLFQFSDTTGQMLYLLIFNDSEQVWDQSASAWVTYEDDDNPSSSADPWAYAIDLEECSTRVGHYSVDVDLSTSIDGWIRYEVFIQEGSSPDSSDSKRGFDSEYLKEGNPYLYDELLSDLQAIQTGSPTTKLSQEDRRLLARLSGILQQQRRGR